MLSDEVVVLAFRDRSLSGQTLPDGARVSANYVLNLVRPVVFAFLKDCAGIDTSQLGAPSALTRISMTSESRRWAMPLANIVEPNGDKLLWQLAG